MNELSVNTQYNEYPEIITYDEKNPTIRSPYATFDLPFYQTRETLMDVDTYRNFLRNVVLSKISVIYIMSHYEFFTSAVYWNND